MTLLQCGRYQTNSFPHYASIIQHHTHVQYMHTGSPYNVWSTETEQIPLRAQEILLVIISLRGWVDPQGHSADGRIMSM